ncbi:uncharacterized protein MYCGRDRAFT_106482 [Zymoseptoria tritici IPO323]|uniref:Uncharacterized protein n=1 Tax=Zymoseptoria tritici (strain CBS 115943 / IPO323) TaxID=336722 RepID=F9XPV7_ZYMTI|nr:uncharacterized protein MYCGRDRAFT_106482 [Zymoseptoria tritici IPO323]EGP82534.1 hypothetical protein MYCGRDRAFT_106482 [Zymoseptoria tritici IPO323]
MREISQDTGRSVSSIRTAWFRSGCQACPPCPIAFSKEETSSIRSLIRLGATLDKMLEHVSESSRPALEPWLRDVEIRLVRSRVPQPPMSEDDMKLIERLRLDLVRWTDIADRFGRTVDATRNQFKLWQKKNKNRDLLLRRPPNC